MSALQDRLSSRIDELERTEKANEEKLRLHEQLSSQRQEALLATIEALEEEVAGLKARLDVATNPIFANTVTGPKTTTVVSEDNKGRAEDKLTEKSAGLSASIDDVELSEESDKVSRSQVSLVLSKENELERKESRPSIEGGPPCLKHATESEPTVLNTHSSENILVLRSSKSGTHQSSVPASYADQVRRDGPSTVVDASTADGFTRVVRRKRSRGTGGRVPVSSQQASRSASTGLRGAERVRCKAFHLARVSLESTPQDVIAFCRKARVTVTGCYILPSRVWGTQSFKVYIDEACEQQVLGETFWPAHLRCRLWEREPPRSNVERGKDDAPSSRSSRPASPSA